MVLVSLLVCLSVCLECAGRKRIHSLSSAWFHSFEAPRFPCAVLFYFDLCHSSLQWEFLHRLHLIDLPREVIETILCALRLFSSGSGAVRQAESTKDQEDPDLDFNPHRQQSAITITKP
jgi:hypothetical protein